MIKLAEKIKRVSYHPSRLYALRMLIAFTGTAFVPYLIHQQILTIPLTLGVVAAALSDLDDRFSVHLRNLLYTYLGFFITASSVQLLFPYPVFFGLGLIISCIVLVLLGSLGKRYATISYGAMIVAVYAMLGAHLFEHWYQQPVYLLAGAIWYGLLTSITYLLFPVRNLEDHLSQCYDKLGNFLYAKSTLFDIDLDAVEFEQAYIELTLSNSKLVAILNQTRVTLLGRLKGDRGQKSTRRSLQYYFVAQDIHERGDSAHIDYQRLASEFRHSDILFRLQRLLNAQARACQQLAKCIRLHEVYIHDPRFMRYFERLQQAIDLQLIQTKNPIQLNGLSLVLVNLKAINNQLANIGSQYVGVTTNQSISDSDHALRDDSLNGLDDIWQRIRQNLTPESVLFRHAIRLAIVLLISYIFIQVTQITHGYWIMLTALFVCQPNFNATQRRLKLRIVGTLAGILLGLPILYFIPSVEGQLIILIIAGVLFFELRSQQYAQATAFITLLALINLNLDGSGFDAALPRIIDTVIGCFFAWLGASFIWPDWQFRRLPHVIQLSMQAQCDYLTEIVQQYHQGKRNDLNYRIKRRAAHNSDAELASLISMLATEPDQDAIQISQSFHLLCLNHTFLSYISALGAHRTQLQDQETLVLLDDSLNSIKRALLYAEKPTLQTQAATDALKARLHTLSVAIDSKEQLVLQQIRLLMGVLPEITQLSQQLSFNDNSDENALAAL